MTTRSIGSGVGSAGPGTVTTVGTTSVVGTLTTFTSTFTLPATIKIGSTVYDIATITNDTHLTTVQTQGTNTNVAYTVGLRQYSSINQWAAYVNALMLSAPEAGQCYNDAEFTSSAGITIGGWAGGSATNTVTLTTASGQSFQDNVSVQTNALRYNQTNGVGVSMTGVYGASQIVITTGNIIVSLLQIKSTNATAQGVLNASAIPNCIFQNLIAYGPVRSGSAHITLASSTTAGLIQNVAIMVTSAGGNGLQLTQGAGVGSSVFGVSVVASNSSSGTGIRSTYSPNPTIKNCAVAGFTTDYSGTCGTSANNATDKGSFGGTGFGTSGQVSIVGSTEWQSVTNGSEDLRLNVTSAKLKDNGATAGLSTDIAGTSRPQGSAYDIACWELIASAAFQAAFAAQSRGVLGGGFASV